MRSNTAGIDGRSVHGCRQGPSDALVISTGPCLHLLQFGSRSAEANQSCRLRTTFTRRCDRRNTSMTGGRCSLLMPWFVGTGSWSSHDTIVAVRESSICHAASFSLDKPPTTAGINRLLFTPFLPEPHYFRTPTRFRTPTHSGPPHIFPIFGFITHSDLVFFMTICAQTPATSKDYS